MLKSAGYSAIHVLTPPDCLDKISPRISRAFFAQRPRKVAKFLLDVLWSDSVEKKRIWVLSALLPLFSACTQETQNKFGRAIQNWTGTNGVLEIYAGDKLVKRFVEIDKLSTAVSTQGDTPRPYRFGYGVMDENLNGVKDSGERKVYFEISDYSTPYLFYESPR